MSNTSTQIFPKSKTSFSRSTPVQIQCAPIETLRPSGRTMNMTLPTSASIALCRIYTSIGNAIEYTQSCQNSREYIYRYVHGNLITMNMQVSYAKHPIQNEARPHKIQVHLASNGSQRQTTLIRIIKAH